MHTIELLQQALETAEKLGYAVREEWLGGAGSGVCEFKGRKWIFLDSSLNPVEQLDQVCSALRDDPAIYLVNVPTHLRHLLDVRRSA